MKIEVIAYSGYKANESPRAFIIDGERINIVKVISAWIEEEISAADRRRFFTVKGSDDKAYVIYFDEDQMQWYCSRK